MCANIANITKRLLQQLLQTLYPKVYNSNIFEKIKSKKIRFIKIGVILQLKNRHDTTPHPLSDPFQNKHHITFSNHDRFFDEKH